MQHRSCEMGKAAFFTPSKQDECKNKNDSRYTDENPNMKRWEYHLKAGMAPGLRTVTHLLQWQGMLSV